MNTFKMLLGLSLLTTYSVDAQTTAGKTLISKGKVNATANEQSRALKRRSVIFDSDVVTTGKNSKAQLRMLDGGMIALKQNTELQISDYRFSDENGRGSVVMELVKGGLRSVTGAIKAENGDYNLKTPTGSIGIRGTHYEVELINGDMFLAVWDGAVDVTVETPTGENTVSFGDGEDFSFGVVSEEGEVTELLEPPETFTEGHSTDDSEEEESEEGSEEESSDSESNEEDSDSEESDADSDSEESEDESTDTEENTEESTENSSEESDEDTSSESEGSESVDNSDSGQGGNDANDSQDTSSQDSNDEPGESNEPEPSLVSVETPVDATPPEPENIAQDVAISDQTEVVVSTVAETFQTLDDGPEFDTNDGFNAVETKTTEELLAERTGTFSYSKLDAFSANSTVGATSNFTMNMDVNFDNGTIPTGQMSFDDDGGEWFAAFSGIISVDQLNLDITFASHGNNLANGSIDASFFDGLDSVIGEFELYELRKPDVKAIGSFLLK